jgi:glycosyltransferase involved in cell wall biosynthesis
MGTVTSHDAPRVSVVVCTRDRPDDLPVALDAILSSTYRDFELIVVDQSADERTSDAVPTWPSGIPAFS